MIQRLKDLTPLPHPDNPVPQPLPDVPVDVPLPPYVPPVNLDPYVPPIDDVPPQYEHIPEEEVTNTLAPYVPILPSGIDPAILAGTAAAVVGIDNQVYPSGSNDYQPINNPPQTLPVAPVVTDAPPDTWARGDDIRYVSGIGYVSADAPNNDQFFGEAPLTEVSDLMGTVQSGAVSLYW